MKRILVTGAGGTPATNFVRSLRDAPEDFHLIGVDCDKYYLQRAETEHRFLVPLADDPDYVDVLASIIEETGADMVYAQTDQEIGRISPHRDELGALTFMPAHATIELCHDKFRSWEAWKRAGLRVPETTVIQDDDDLVQAFEMFGAPLWLRAIVSPGGGRGSFRAENLGVARAWIDFCEGWGNFTAAECLRPDSTTWMSIWRKGELLVAQGRRRIYWEFANRSPSGVTGITGTGVTVADERLDELAQQMIFAVDPEPHGIYSTDFTYDYDDIPNPTEINIGRFFTTHYFFTKAGLNMPYILVKSAFGEEVELPAKRINPLPEGLAWVRGMDFQPVLTDIQRIDQPERELAERRQRLRD